MSLHPSGSIPQSLSCLSPDEQFRLMRAEFSKYKRQLVQLLQDEKSPTTNEILEKLCRINLPVTSVLTFVNINDIIDNNCGEKAAINWIISCFNCLEKYGSNLLFVDDRKPWRKISFRNAAYDKTVNVIQGARDILQNYGYEMTQDGFNFDENIMPDRKKVAQVLAEITLIRFHLELYCEGKHPLSQLWDNIMPLDARIKQQDLSLDTGKRNTVKDPAQRFSEWQEENTHLDVTTSTDRSCATYLVPTPVTNPTSTPHGDGHADSTDMCDICGLKARKFRCLSEGSECRDNYWCDECDKIWHNKPSRKNHIRVHFDPIYLSMHGRPPTKATSSAIQDRLSGASYVVMNRPQISVPAGELDSGDYATVREEGSIVIFTPSSSLQAQDDGQYETIPYDKALEAIYLENIPEERGGIKLSQLPSSKRPALPPRPEIMAQGAANKMLPPNASKPAITVDSSLAARLIRGDEKLYIQKDKWRQMEKKTAEIEIASVVADLNRMLQRNEHQTSLLAGNLDSSSPSYRMLLGEKTRIGKMIANFNEFRYEINKEVSPPPVLVYGKVKEEERYALGTDVDMWQCSFCTSHNNSQVKVCAVCSKTNDNRQPVQPTLQKKPAIALPSGGNQKGFVEGRSAYEKWACEYCTSLNPYTVKICDVCGKTNENRKSATPNSDAAGTKCVVQSGLDRAENTTPKKDIKRETTQVDVFKGARPKVFSKPVNSENTTIEHPKPVTYELPQAQTDQERKLQEKQRAKENYERKKRGLPPLPEQSPDGYILPQAQTDQERKLQEKQRAKENYERKKNGLPPLPEIPPLQGPDSARPGMAVRMEQEGGNDTGKPRESMGVIYEDQDEIYFEKKRAKEEYSLRMQEPERRVPNLEKECAKYGFDVHAKVLPQHRSEITPSGTLSRREHSKDQQRYSTLANESRKFISVLKNAEREEYTMEDVEIALVMCPGDPLKWLETELPIMITNLLDIARLQLPEGMNEFLNQLEAKKAFMEAHCNFDLALGVLTNQKHELINRLTDGGKFTVEQVIRTLNEGKGVEEHARVILQRTLLKDFIDKLGVKTEDKDLREVLSNTAINRERRVRMALADGNLQGWMRAENAVTLFEDPDCTENSARDILDAVHDRGRVADAKDLLIWECRTCFTTYPSCQVTSLAMCQCRTCFECLRDYFTVVIKEQHVKNLVCPVCGKPDIDFLNENEDEHLSFLSNVLKNLVDTETHNLLLYKLMIWRLQKHDNFRWCEHCENGFLFNAEGEHNNAFRMTCEKCGKKTCYKCKRKWEPQHDDSTCEAFHKWQRDNDPDFQREGLDRHLHENGIDCPNCKMKFALAKGGCMHFKCTQCGCEFCCGCNGLMRKGDACKIYDDCVRLGLHCHHPRDCLFYLRDKSVAELQKILADNGVAFDIEKKQQNVKCNVMEQKELPDGLRDEACNKDVQANQAGLCEIHYKEYLVVQINKNHIDPVDNMDVDALNVIYGRHRQESPQQRRGETEDAYKQRLVQDIKQKFPLTQRD